MRILHLIDPSAPAEAPALVRRLAAEPGSASHSVLALGEELLEPELDGAVPIHRVEDPLLRPLRPWVLARALSATESADVVQCHSFACAVAGVLGARDRPLVLTLARTWYELPWIARRGYRWLLSRSAAAVAQSRAVRRSFVFGGGPEAGQIETIRAGLSAVPIPAPRVEGRVRVIALADDEAGCELFERAWNTLPPEISERARRTFAGPADTEDWDGADVAVFSSLYGDLPRAALRAMAAGRAIVATLPGGIAEILRNGSEGLLVPAQDPERLAAALTNVLADPELRTRLGRGARARFAERFGIARERAAWNALYARLLQDPHA